MKISKEQLKSIIKEELAEIKEARMSLDPHHSPGTAWKTGASIPRERPGAPFVGGPLTSDAAMAQIAGLVKSTAAQTVPDQALETIRLIVRGWEDAQSGQEY